MAGKVTYKKTDLHAGGWYGTRPLSVSQRMQLSCLIGRRLSYREARRIEKFANEIRANLRVISDPSVSNQDIKRTLAAISKLSPAEAEAAYTKADDDTRCLIVDALLDLNAWGPRPKGADICRAAATAVPRKRSGRPQKGEIVDQMIAGSLKLWRDLGGDPDAKAWHRDGQSSPLVRFVHIIATEAEYPTGLDHIAKAIRPYLSG
ncbi:metal-dependent Rnase [Thiohalobacter thiocyanaticus]|uniref:Metal-dependent Rnase n=1 Tax=Thiohalobacter thiocyanaticus TaxID=585455 RepID=A0A1Z4VRM8_9GAMM|nr:hypothetical protein [Thiohalobacter thiocyanaticus]BAZ94291.1 metal-dependent Rnase [Thiohalobacter thiocyanaticus]